MFSRLYPNEATFLASDGWLRRFLKRNKIIFRRATSVGQKIPDNAPELAEAFLDSMLALPESQQIYNMDESPCYFDVPRAETFDFRGVKTVKLKTTGHEKLRFATVLTAGVRRVSNDWKAIQLPPWPPI